MATITTKGQPAYNGCRYSQEDELNDSLELDRSGNIVARSNGTGSLKNPTLPGQPTLSLHDIGKLQHFLEEDLVTAELDGIAPYLWLVSTQSHAHIAPLHAQVVRGRQIYLTENPSLHLLWIDDRAFVKPLPAYLLSHAFWTKYLDPRRSSLHSPEAAHALSRAALGYLRTWTYLVRHESDFRLAKELHLVDDQITFAQFRRFIDRFSSDDIEDNDVSPRYYFGDLRLSRLNMWSRVLLKRWMFFQIRWHYWQYFAQFYGPMLFIFGVLSVILSAMQVALSTNSPWQAFSDVSKWFSVLTLLVIVAIVVAVLTLLLSLILRELIFASKAKLKKMKGG